MSKTTRPVPAPPRIELTARPLAPQIRRRVDALLDRLLAPNWPPVIWPA
ncbi:hypothetical protein [Streptacidiphilus melanogenes]|nr:hypothetical protein [Streptacidiphilus melanogenes]